MQTDVLIVGAGLTGLALAAALGESRLKVTLLDARPAPPSNLQADAADARVIALGSGSRQFLEKLGAWQLLAEGSAPAFQHIYVADGAGTGSISFSAADEGLSELGHIVGRASLAAALVKIINEQGGTETLWGCRWSGLQKVSDGYQLQIFRNADDDQGEAITTRLLVGADGATSAVREALGLRMFGRQYAQQAHTCLARLTQGHGQTAYQWFTDSGPLAFLPLADDLADANAKSNDKSNDQSSDFGKADDKLVAVIWSSTEAIQGFSDQQLAARLTQASERRLGDVIAVTQRSEFPLAHRHALRYARKGAVILGDAAHIIHPLAGWGANLGFADAELLASELWQAQLLGKSPGDRSVLRRYAVARGSQNLMAGAVMEGFHLLYQPTNPLLSLVRSRGLALAQESTWLKSLFVKAAG